MLDFDTVTGTLFTFPAEISNKCLSLEACLGIQTLQLPN